MAADVPPSSGLVEQPLPLERCWGCSSDFSSFEALLRDSRHDQPLDLEGWREVAGFLYGKVAFRMNAPQSPGSAEAMGKNRLSWYDNATDGLPEYESPPATRAKLTRGTLEGDMIHAISPGSSPGNSLLMTPLDFSMTSLPPLPSASPSQRELSLCTHSYNLAVSNEICTATWIAAEAAVPSGPPRTLPTYVAAGILSSPSQRELDEDDVFQDEKVTQELKLLTPKASLLGRLAPAPALLEAPSESLSPPERRQHRASECCQRTQGLMASPHCAEGPNTEPKRALTPSSARRIGVGSSESADHIGLSKPLGEAFPPPRRCINHALVLASRSLHSRCSIVKAPTPPSASRCSSGKPTPRALGGVLAPRSPAQSSRGMGTQIQSPVARGRSPSPQLGTQSPSHVRQRSPMLSGRLEQSPRSGQKSPWSGHPDLPVPRFSEVLAAAVQPATPHQLPLVYIAAPETTVMPESVVVQPLRPLASPHLSTRAQLVMHPSSPSPTQQQLQQLQQQAQQQPQQQQKPTVTATPVTAVLASPSAACRVIPGSCRVSVSAPAGAVVATPLSRSAGPTLSTADEAWAWAARQASAGTPSFVPATPPVQRPLVRARSSGVGIMRQPSMPVSMPSMSPAVPIYSSTAPAVTATILTSSSLQDLGQRNGMQSVGTPSATPKGTRMRSISVVTQQRIGITPTPLRASAHSPRMQSAAEANAFGNAGHVAMKVAEKSDLSACVSPRFW